VEGGSSFPERGDLPIAGAGCPFRNCAEDDRRDEDDRGGVTPPTPCREFIEAFLCNVVGVEERASRLVTLGLLRRGIRGVVFVHGDGGGFPCPRVLRGDATCGEAGRAVPEAVDRLRRLNCETVASLFTVDSSKGECEAAPIPGFGDELSMAHTTSGELPVRQRRTAVSLKV
jgi:hypothetical protein